MCAASPFTFVTDNAHPNSKVHKKIYEEQKQNNNRVFVMAIAAGTYAFAAPGGDKVKVKIIKIVDGDTTITEKITDGNQNFQRLIRK